MNYFTPQEVKNEMRLIDSELAVMMSDVDRSAKVDKDKKNSFKVFCDDWSDFVKDYSSWLSRSFNSTAEKVTEYRRRTLAWQEIFKRDGLETGTLELISRNKPSSSILADIPWWVWLGGGGLLIWKLSPLRTAERVGRLVSPGKKAVVIRK